MTKLDQAATAYYAAHQIEDSEGNGYDGFLAGALWLLEQAKKHSWSDMFGNYEAVYIGHLRELCEEEK